LANKKTLDITHPEVAAEWHLTKNGDLKPSDVTYGNTKRVWWKCKTCDREWMTRVVRRTSEKTKCKSCGQRNKIKNNSLAVTHSEIAKEWHPTKNGYLALGMVSRCSHDTVWWICSTCKYEWQCFIPNRTRKKYGCPACAGRIATKEISFAKYHPNLVKEWHTKNKIKPTDIRPKSAKKVWWICSNCSHEWRTTPGKRSIGQGCPICSISQGEKKIKEYLDQNEFEYKQEYRITECKNEKPLPFDFVVFLDNIVLIEYHGKQHYKSVPYFGGNKHFTLRQKCDKIKQDYCKNHNIPLIIIPYWDFEKVEKILEKEMK